MVNPLFSILIPVYNVEKYLPACLESVLAQDFDDYEIILVDDGSKDASGHICDDYCASYPDKIRVQHKPNQGLISARRVGLKLAVGEYICFLDSDDCLAVGMLGRLYETIQSTRSDVILFSWSCIDENGAKAVTHYERLKYKNGHSLAKVSLETGKTHQIRLHMRAIGHPLPADVLYNPNFQVIRRHALHSWKLEFEHPITKEKMYFEQELPEDMKKILGE